MTLMEFSFPEKLNATEALQLALDLRSLPTCDTYIFDFGMLLAAASMRAFVQNRCQAGLGNPKFQGKNFKSLGYAAHMGFFQSVGLDYGNLPGQATGGPDYLPITKPSVSELLATANSENVYVGEIVELESRRLACVLVQQDQGVLVDAITYSLREIMRNAIEHSGADSVWYAAHHWPRLRQVELAILDQGVGVRKSLSRNSQLKIAEDARALVMALQPGISGVPKRRRRRLNNGHWANSGYGLFMSSQLCRKGGAFTICSGSKAVTLKGIEGRTADT